MGQLVQCCDTESILKDQNKNMLYDTRVKKKMDNAKIVLYMHELSQPCRAVKSLLEAGHVIYK